MTQRVQTEALLERLPIARRYVAPFITTTFLGKKEIVPEISLSQAIALAAFAQARSRGVNRAKRVYDVVFKAKDDIADALVVVPRGGPVQLVPSHGFEPAAAVVIDLNELESLVRAGLPIPG